MTPTRAVAKETNCPVVKLTSDSVLRISFLGHPRLISCNLNLERLSSNIVSEVFVLRSRRASPLIKPRFTPWWVARGEMCVLKCLSRLVMSTNVKCRVVPESIPFINDCV